jgi:hypothetical protein
MFRTSLAALLDPYYFPMIFGQLMLFNRAAINLFEVSVTWHTKSYMRININ